MGDNRRARDLLNGALLLAPQVPAAHLWLGRIAQHEGQADRTIAEHSATGALRELAHRIGATAPRVAPFNLNAPPQHIEPPCGTPIEFPAPDARVLK